MLYVLLPGPPHLGLLPLFLLLPLPGPQQVSWVGGRGKAEGREKSAGNRSLMEAQGQVGGLREPRRRDFHSPGSQGPREWGLSWKSNWMEAASGSSALGPSSGHLSSSWKPPAYSSQWCAPTLTVLSLVELGTYTCDLTSPLQSSSP